MCSQEDVREVVIERTPAPWVQMLVQASGAIALVFLMWLTYSVQSQPAHMESELGKVKTANAVLNATLAVKMEMISKEIAFIKVLSEERLKDRYTATNASLRAGIVDGRDNEHDIRLSILEMDI